MNQSKYTLLFMRDDSAVRRIRLHPLIVRLCVVFGAVCLVAVCLGGYSSVHFWRKNIQLTQTIQRLTQTVQSRDSELKRLRTLEQLIKKDDREDLSSLVASAQARTTKGRKEPFINLQDILPSIDHKVFSVANIQAHITSENIRLSFDVNKRNPNENGVLKGHVDIHLTLTSGRVITLVDKAEKNFFFELRRMKQFHLDMGIPESVSADDIFGIRISIVMEPSDHMVFSETYPLSHIRV